MARVEIAAILAGCTVTDLIPPWSAEAIADYAERATGVLMVRYLARDADET